MSLLINGKKISGDIKAEIKDRVSELSQKGKTVVLSIVLVGNDPASIVYMESKIRTFNSVGIKTDVHKLPAKTTTAELIEVIEKLNKKEDCDAIIIENPLPEHIDSKKIILAIDPKKDVDGLHPSNLGNLCTREDGFYCCTPAGVVELLKRSGVEISGKNCVVAGRSNIVGRPMALLMLNEDATVTVVHTKTKNIKEICKTADILITAVGQPKMFNREYVKDGAVVVDIGINSDENGNICGDVDFDDVEKVCSAITPVPGGVGPVTVAVLMEHVLKAAEGNIR